MDYISNDIQMIRQLESNGNMKEEPGLYIVIEERKCGKNVQPYIVLNDVLKILEVGALKNGAMVLKCEQRNPKSGNGRICNINADRFSWKVFTEHDMKVAEQYAHRVYFETLKECQEKRRQEEDKASAWTLTEYFDESELIQISFVHLVLAELVWEYADACMNMCANYRIECLKKLIRTYRGKREEYDKGNIGNSLDARMADNLRRNAREFSQSRAFMKESRFAWDVMSNLMRKQNPGDEIDYLDLRIVAELGLMMIRVYNRQIDKVNAMIEERVKKEGLNSVRNPVISDMLKSFFIAIVSGWQIKECKQMDLVLNSWCRLVDGAEFWCEGIKVK